MFLIVLAYTEFRSTCITSILSTPPFPPDCCYLPGAPCQMIVRRMSVACQIPCQTSVNSQQTSVRQVPHITRHVSYICTATRGPPDIHLRISCICRCLMDVCWMHIWYMSGAHVVYVWLMCGTSLTDVWWELTDIWWGI